MERRCLSQGRGGNPFRGRAGRLDVAEGKLPKKPLVFVLALNCRLGARTGSSSSSPLEVRSMTAEIGRLLLVEPGLLGVPDDSRDLEGPPTSGLYAEGAPIRTLSPDLVISTMSSSESLATPFVLEFDAGRSFLLFSSHLASG
jgi:hypothetical protein